MKTKKYIRILIFSIICVSLFFCKREEVTLHGDLSGIITDATTSEPIQGVGVKLSLMNDTTSTGSDGKYLFKNLTPGEHEVEVSKIGYDPISTNVHAFSAKTTIANFALEGIPVSKISVTSLDFMMDLSILSFSISNIGIGTLHYNVIPSQGWIIVDPSSGSITDQIDSLTVTIDRSGLDESTIYKETIKIIFDEGDDIVDVFLNRSYIFIDARDGREYKAVKIGEQWWMAENLNIGTYVESKQTLVNHSDVSDNDIIEKYCYDNNEAYCDTLGGLYDWNEMMQYNPSDAGVIGTIQGVCPDGWHLPTEKEWTTMINYLGGKDVAGGKLKATGTTYWFPPNEGATNETGFTALGAGIRWQRGEIMGLKDDSFFWSATEKNSEGIFSLLLLYSNTDFETSTLSKYIGVSVRCVRDPVK